jgi:hypothetical protein
MVSAPAVPNELFIKSRKRLFDTQQECADAANTLLPTSQQMTAGDVSKIECGRVHKPHALRRSALRTVLKARTDAEIGLVRRRAVPAKSTDVDTDSIEDSATRDRSPSDTPASMFNGAGNEPAWGKREIARQTDLTAEPPQPTLTDRSLSPGIVRRAGAAWFAMLKESVTDLPDLGVASLELPRKVERPHVQALRHSLDLFEQSDHQYGGGLARAAMAGQLAWACHVARHASMMPTIREGWQSTTARLGDLAGWACFDAGDQPAIVQRFFVAAIELAAEADDDQQRTHTATSLSRHLTYVGRLTDALQIVDLARLDWRKLPALGRAVIGIVEARIHAKAGDREACRRAVDHCDTQFAASDPDENDPTWGYYADTGQILGDAGHAMFDLAMTPEGAADADKTIRRLQAAYDTHPAETARSRALTMIRVACLQARHHDLAEGLNAAELALADAQHLHSHRVADDLRLLDATLVHAPGDPRSAERLVTVRQRIANLVDAMP